MKSPIYLGAVFFAALMALWVVKLRQEAKILPRKPPVQQSQQNEQKIVLPSLGIVSGVPAVAAQGRNVPQEVKASAEMRTKALAPGLVLKKVEYASKWRAHRALIYDQKGKDTRKYAIGDLLPHGNLLVGIKEQSIDILVGDAELVRLSIDAVPRSLTDFSEGRGSLPKRKAAKLSQEFIQVAHQAVADTLQSDPQSVQAAIDALIEAGDPAVEILVQYMDSRKEVWPHSYAFPTGSDGLRRPQNQGALILCILEAVTGKSFGDPTVAEDLPEVLALWEEWWGL